MDQHIKSSLARTETSDLRSVAKTLGVNGDILVILSRESLISIILDAINVDFCRKVLAQYAEKFGWTMTVADDTPPTVHLGRGKSSAPAPDALPPEVERRATD